MREIEFLFDFGSPNAFLVHRAIPTIEAREDVQFGYVPVLLGGIFKATGNQSPAQTYGHIAAKRAYDRLEIERFCSAHGITDFVMNPHFPVNTLLIMRGLVAARRAGVEDTYLAVVLAAMWENAEKMDDPEVVRRVLDAGGLDGEALIAATQDPEVKAELVANTEAAVERGVFGIPTFFVGDEMFFGKERLGQVEEEVVRQMADT